MRAVIVGVGLADLAAAQGLRFIGWDARGAISAWYRPQVDMQRRGSDW
jgi:hypothetical protein